MEEVFAFRYLNMNYEQWLSKIKPDKKIRGYRHIDDPLDLNKRDVFERVVTVLENIKEHQFLPLIKHTRVSIRLGKNTSGNLEKSLKSRPIMYASHMDSHVYSYYNFILSEKYEFYIKNIGLDASVIAYRTILQEGFGGKNNIHFAKEVFDHIKSRGECVVVVQDIKSFFDNIDHTLLKKRLSSVLAAKELDEDLFKVFKSLTRYKYVEYSLFQSKQFKNKLSGSGKYAIYKRLKDFVRENKTGRGIPQGSPISGLFANIYMIVFDEAVSLRFPNTFYRRYSDDLIFVCDEKEKEDLLRFVDSNLKENRLTINNKKTHIAYFKRQKNGLLACSEVTGGSGEKTGRNYVDYLGFEFDGEDVSFRKNTVQKIRRSQTRRAVKRASNVLGEKRTGSKKRTVGLIKKRASYLKVSTKIMNSLGVKKQSSKVARYRNRVHKKTTDKFLLKG